MFNEVSVMRDDSFLRLFLEGIGRTFFGNSLWLLDIGKELARVLITIKDVERLSVDRYVLSHPSDYPLGAYKKSVGAILVPELSLRSTI